MKKHYLLIAFLCLAEFSCEKSNNIDQDNNPVKEPRLIGIVNSSIKYVDLADIVFIGDPANYSYDYYLLNMNADSINDFKLTLATGHSIGSGETYGKSWIDSIGLNKVSCGFLNKGDTLDKNISWCEEIDLTGCGDDRYVALRVVAQDTLYGWVKVSAENYSILTILEYAWFLK